VLRTAQAVVPEGVTTALYGSLAELPAFNPDDDHESLHPVVAVRIAVGREAVGADGLIADAEIRLRIAAVLETLAQHLRATPGLLDADSRASEQLDQG
jgi:hypothetical protein